MHQGYGTSDSPNQQQAWQYENPFAPRWDLSLFGFPTADGTMNAMTNGDGGAHAGGGSVAGGMQFPDMSDASMAELSQLLLGFSSGSIS